MSTTKTTDHMTRCPETGLFVESYITDWYSDWTPELPEGWEVFDDRYSTEERDEHMKRCEDIRVRRIGPRNMVLQVAVAQVPGVTFTPAVAA